jgi:hypothetical protein
MNVSKNDLQSFSKKLFKYRVLQGVLEASKLPKLGSNSRCPFVKPAKSAS